MFFGSDRRIREFIRSCRLFCIVSWERRRLYIITAEREASEAEAWYEYLDSCYTSVTGDINSAVSSAQGSFDSYVSAARSYQTSIWNAAASANESTYTAIRSANATSESVSYLTTMANANWSMSTGLISAFGTYQTGWRQERLAKIPYDSSYRIAWQKEAEWASRIAPVRDAYFTGLGTAMNTFNSSLLGAIGSYSNSWLDAEIALGESRFNAERSQSESQFENMVAREQALLSASLIQAQNKAVAEWNEELGNARIESESKRERSNRINDALFANQDGINGALNGTNSQGNFPSNPESGFSHENVDNAALANLLDQLNHDFTEEDCDSQSAITTGESGNTETRTTNDAQADSTCATAVANAQIAYTAAESATESAYTAALESANNAYAASLEQAQSAYETSVIPALTALNSTYASITCLYSQAVATIDNDTAIGNNYFETEDAEVCFVAGTPILMADGTSKPIEEIRPGDMVLSVDHNDPEKDTPKPARVTRFFDNGLKSVVKLLFENQKTGEQFEVVCTPSHRFYVKNKGWINAEALQTGEQCISAKETEITFISREELKDAQRVYNFEVEEKHTYFLSVSEMACVLVHNQCSACGGTGKIIRTTLAVAPEVIGYFDVTIEETCPVCQQTLYKPEQFARQYITNSVFGRNWRFVSLLEKNAVYALGCVGISMVSLEAFEETRHIETIKFPHMRDDANLFLSYDEARDFYLQCRNNGLTPALMMYADVCTLQRKTSDTNAPLNKHNYIIPSVLYDYRLLALIDQGLGPQAVWIHAEGGWKNPSSANRVIVSPVENLQNDGWSALYIVIPSAGRSGLVYILNWDIPPIPGSMLPQPFEIN